MNWYVIRTKPKKEFLASHYFKKMDQENYLVSQKIHSKNGTVKDKLLLPSYIFLKSEKLNYSQVNLNPYTSNVLSRDGVPVIVSDNEISAMQKHINSSYLKSDFNQFKVGSIATIPHGSFQGKTGKVVVKSNNKISIMLSSLDILITVSLKDDDA